MDKSILTIELSQNGTASELRPWMTSPLAEERAWATHAMSCRNGLQKIIVLSFVLLINYSTLSWGASHSTQKDDTLAVIGGKVITKDQFTKLYKEKLVTLGLTDNGEMRRGYLINLVDDEILIAEAKIRKLDQTTDARAERKRLELQELLNAFSTRHLSAMVKVTDDDLANLFVKMNKKVKVSHLYAPTKQKADLLYEQIQKGQSFRELAKENFSDAVLRENGGSLGYISFDEMDPDFEKAAFSMQIGEISRPVKTVEGYSIIKVEDIQQNPLLTQGEFLKAREKMMGFARKRKFEDAVRQYTTTLRKDLSIRFNKSFITRLFDLIQHQSLQSVIESPSGSISPKELRKTAVSTTSGVWSGKELIDALSLSTVKQRKWIHTEENFEDFISGLIMRQYIARNARNEHLDATISYRDNVAYAFDSYLLNTLEEELKNNIVFSQDSLRSFYENNRNLFRTDRELRLSGILLDNRAGADSVRGLLTHGERFDELAKRFSVQRLTAEKGGDLGFLRAKDLGRFGKEVFALHVGEWTGPLIEENNYLMLECTDVKEPVEKSFEESSKDIEHTLLTMTWIDARKKYVDSTKSMIPCRIYPERVMTLTL